MTPITKTPTFDNPLKTTPRVRFNITPESSNLRAKLGIKGRDAQNFIIMYIIRLTEFIPLLLRGT